MGLRVDLGLMCKDLRYRGSATILFSLSQPSLSKISEVTVLIYKLSHNHILHDVASQDHESHNF